MPNLKLSLEITNNIMDFSAAIFTSEVAKREALTNLVVSILAQVDGMIEDRVVAHLRASHEIREHNDELARRKR